MNIRIEASSAVKSSATGVGYYTKSLIEALQNYEGVSVSPFVLAGDAHDSSVQHLGIIPRRLYVKLIQAGIRLPFDRRAPMTDLTLFPDFSLWKTRHSRINAVVIHDLTYRRYPQYMRVRSIGPLTIPVTTLYLSRVVAHAVKNADFLITVSESTKHDLVESFGVKPESIIVTPIPPSNAFLEQAKAPISKEVLLDTYSIPTAHYILSVGTIEPRKNQQAILDAYLALPEDVRRTHSLVLAGGPGWSSDTLIASISHAVASGEHIVMTGYFDEKDSYALYAHAAVFTSASHYEGFGMPALEAMAAKTPVVVSDIPVFREVCGDAALYVEASDTNSYAETLLRVVSEPEISRLLVEKGLTNTGRYSWQRNAEAIINKTRQLLDNRS